MRVQLFARDNTLGSFIARRTLVQRRAAARLPSFRSGGLSLARACNSYSNLQSRFGCTLRLRWALTHDPTNGARITSAAVGYEASSRALLVVHLCIRCFSLAVLFFMFRKRSRDEGVARNSLDRPILTSFGGPHVVAYSFS